MNEIIDVIHKTIYQFFDVCGDDEESPMSDKDKLLLEVNKAICNKLKELEQEPKTGHWIIIDDCEQFIAKCSECDRIEDSRMISKFPYCHCGAKMVEQTGK